MLLEVVPACSLWKWWLKFLVAWLFFRVWDHRRTTSVAKRQVIPEGPWTGRERCRRPTRSSQDELAFLKRKTKTNILLHKDIGHGKSKCVEWWIWLFFSSQCLKDGKRSLQKLKKITILSVFYLSMFRLELHCYVNRNHNNKNWTYLF